MPVAAALLWKHAIYNPVYGLLNGLLTMVGGPQPDWITDFPRLAIEVQLIWYWTPFMTLILLAGLQSRPGDILEAANVDGASSGRPSASSPCPICDVIWSSAACSARSMSSRPSTRCSS